MSVSCTHNDGDIGDWFGHWKLNEIVVDGTVDANYEHNMFFSFQNSVFAQTIVYPDNSVDRLFANWTDCGNYLIIEYAYAKDEKGNPIYSENGDLVALFYPAPITRMSIGENIVNVDYINGNNLQLSMTDSIGQKITYKLEKW